MALSFRPLALVEEAVPAETGVVYQVFNVDAVRIDLIEK